MKDIRKILVVTLSNLGDVVLTLPVFQSLIEGYPEAQIDVMVGPGAREVFEGDARIRRVIVYDKKISWAEKFSLLRGVRAGRYDLIVDLRRSLFGLLGGAKFRNPYLDLSKKRRHMARRHLSVLKGLAPRSFSGRSFLSGQVPPDSKLIVAAVGSKSDIKKWPPEHYARLLDRLVFHQGYRVALVGDKNDAADAQKVKGLMSAPVSDLCGETTFRELCSVIGRATLLISNDSAPVHVADALGVPVLAIFGPTDPRKYGPRSSGSVSVRRELFCSPCEKAQCRYHHECMTQLSAEEVYREAVRILNDEPRDKHLKILVVRLDRIGDVVLSLPTIEAIHRRFPTAKISVLTRPATSALVERHPDVDEVISYHYEGRGGHRFFIGYARFIREIIKRRFDIAFILHPSVRSHLIGLLAGIPYRVGFDSHLGWALTHRVADRRSEGLKHESDTTADIARAFHVEVTSDQKPRLPVFADERLEMDRVLAEKGWGKEARILALHPGASCVSKRWPAEKFAALLDRILAESPLNVAVIGSTEEKTLGESLCAGRGSRALNFCGELGLGWLPVLLSRSEALVSNDSGPVHVAAAVGTPTLAIFGRNRAGLNARRWKALGEGHRVIQKDVGCVVCLAHRCTIGFECLKAIRVEEVFDELTGMLKHEPRHLNV